MHADAEARVPRRLHTHPKPGSSPEVSECPEGGLLEGHGAEEDPGVSVENLFYLIH